MNTFRPCIEDAQFAPGRLNELRPINSRVTLEIICYDVERSRHDYTK